MGHIPLVWKLPFAKKFNQNDAYYVDPSQNQEVAAINNILIPWWQTKSHGLHHHNGQDGLEQ